MDWIRAPFHRPPDDEDTIRPASLELISRSICSDVEGEGRGELGPQAERRSVFISGGGTG